MPVYLQKAGKSVHISLKVKIRAVCFLDFVHQAFLKKYCCLFYKKEEVSASEVIIEKEEVKEFKEEINKVKQL